LVSGCYGNINLRHIDSYICIKTVVAHKYMINTLLLLPGGYFATGSSDNKLKIWDMGVNVLKNKDETVFSLALLKDYRIISTAGDKILIMNY
jgi:WD40 repeat protein